MEQADEWFLRELHAQFKYDKRLSARFCFIDGDRPYMSPFFRTLGSSIVAKHISKISISYYDAAIFLTKKDYNVGDIKIIRFAELENFFIQRTYVDIPLLNFLQRNPSVKLFLTNFPSKISRYKGGNEFEKTLWEFYSLLGALKKNKGNPIETPFDKFGYTNEEVIELLDADKSKENLDGTTSLIDDERPLVNIHNGQRVTAYQPEHYKNKIYFFGPCYYAGRNAPFDKTIESYLQKMLNEHDLPYCVENCGQAFSERTQDMFYNLNAVKFAPGDIVFIYIWGLCSNDDNIPFCDVSDALDPPHDYRELFCTKRHVNELGYKLLAEKYFKFLTENNFFRDKEFNYPLPPPILSQIRHTSLGRAWRRKVRNRQRRARSLQRTA